MSRLTRRLAALTAVASTLTLAPATRAQAELLAELLDVVPSA